MKKGKILTKTVLFLDLRGASRLVGEDNLEKLAEIVRSLFEKARKELRDAEFRRYQGDEIMAVYSEAIPAVNDALRLRKECSKMLFEVGLDAGIGIHRDKGFFWDTMDKDIKIIRFGDVFNIAKRLEGASYGGDITISETVFHELDPEVRKHFAAKQSMKIKNWGKSLRTYVSVR